MVEPMKGMKLRLLGMGGIISVLGLGLMALVGVRFQFELLLGVGLMIFIAGLAWK